MVYIPQRTCMGCGAKKEKQELLRLTKNKQNAINTDQTGKNEGRGAYICYNVDCLNKCIKNRRLERNLGIKIENEIYEKLKGVILKWEGYS
ncbi:MAG: YlxR family protein [Oscillospiraceae bacterium]|nr:YlxR family protein [Oscillospiraceae bacterium]